MKRNYCFCLKPYKAEEMDLSLPIANDFGETRRISYTEAIVILFSIAFGLGWSSFKFDVRYPQYFIIFNFFLGIISCYVLAEVKKI